jgi:hypothetical protein
MPFALTPAMLNTATSSGASKRVVSVAGTGSPGSERSSTRMSVAAAAPRRTT